MATTTRKPKLAVVPAVAAAPDYRLEIDPQTLTIDDMIVIQEAGQGAQQMRELKGFIVRHLRDAEGQPLPAEEAARIVGGWTMRRIEQLGRDIQSAAVPPPTGGA